VYNMRGTNVSSGTTRAILDQSLADFSVNPGGPGQKREADLQNFGVFWEERLGNNTFMELAHNFQWSRSTSNMSGQGRRDNAALFADPNLFLPDGSPNPYAGGLMFEGDRWNRIKNWDRSHSTRAQVSHELDTGKWGNYRFALMGEYEWRSNRKHIDAEVWEGAPFHAIPDNASNLVYRRFYVTPGDWSTYYATGAEYTGLLRNVPDPTDPGRTLNSTWTSFNQGGRSNPHEYQRTLLIGGQARYFDGRLVAGVGVRKDKLDLKAVRAVRDPVTNEWTLDHPDITREFYGFHGTTRTLGLVGHVNRHVSLFYNFSNSLDIPNTQHLVLPEGRPPSPPDARGQDFGVALNLFDGRLVARANAFEVDLENASGAGFGGTFSNPTVLNNDVLNALLAAGGISQAQADARTFTSNNAIRDRRLEGYEFNLTGAITSNWRVTFSYSYTDGFDSAIAPEIKAWAAEALPWFLQWPNVVTNVTGSDGQLMTVAQRVALWENNAGQEWLREGDLILGNRKHKYSIFTRYSLNAGPLNGAYFGGGYRHQSKSPIGFDSNRDLQYDGSYWEADMLLGYRLSQLRFFRRGLNLQLNIKNLFDNRDPLITQYNSSNIIERVMIRTPRTWRLTANFDF
jgi:hypothetical protein